MAAQKSLNEDYKSDGKWKEIWRRFKKNKGAVIGLVLLVVLTVILVGAPLFISYDKAITQNMDLMLAKPSVGNLSATTDTGATFSRVLSTVDVFPLLLRFLRRFLHACLAAFSVQSLAILVAR